MSEFFKAELKDKFLRYALFRDDFFEVDYLYNEFLHPNYSLSFAQQLILEIQTYDPDLIDTMSGNGAKVFMLSAKAATQEFLDQGGFTQLFIQEEEKWDNFIDHLGVVRNTDKRKTIGVTTTKPKYRKEKLLLYGLFSAVAISFIFTLYSIATKLMQKENYISVTDFAKSVNELKIENKRLEEQVLQLQAVLQLKDSTAAGL
ncbi:hypothetical protein [Croceivirga sp. JEA036]|uniref:hypothetical protein n=1 Tax=Croceivirga sp. JEA036 TaxID=2721162 RepID=UPI001438C660|nr:hypothetical protein [Croceivirga sp. JEA036]NJB37391.1 hypothetical protein [Croceivirga sp. JEA036]